MCNPCPRTHVTHVPSLYTGASPSRPTDGPWEGEAPADPTELLGNGGFLPNAYQAIMTVDIG